ncbi:MAG: 16S rRNA (guanine(527)-N(7))-methyltransferase RsmG [Acidobacteria bacterium]|nr:16S rRNA (guanine(527)-N(7))-methyltransferase RsmG [Acidobacteriota bacterium]
MAAAPSNIFDIKCFEALLDPVLKTLRLTLDPPQMQLLRRHMELLLQWSRKINLTSVRDPAEIIRRHFGESLFVAAHLGVETGTLVDIGSGAGFPGFPVAVAKPHVAVTLVESVGKKAAFLKEVSRDVSNVSIFRGRFENLHSAFDWATVRGVSMDRLIAPISLRCKGFFALVGKDEAAALALDPRLRCHEPAPLPWQPDRVLASGSCFT